jgi:hypothetical protein
MSGQLSAVSSQQRIGEGCEALAMTAIHSTASVLICGSGDCWKVATESDPTEAVEQRTVVLEINGDAQDGFHLNMSPEGCFTADTWHETQEDARQAALRLFGVPLHAWTACGA